MIVAIHHYLSTKKSVKIGFLIYLFIYLFIYMQINFSSVQFSIICILQQLACTAVATREMLYASVLFMTQTRFCSPFDVSSQRHSFCA